MTSVKAAWTSLDMFKASLKKNKPEETKCNMLAHDYNGYLHKEPLQTDYAFYDSSC